MLQFSPFRTIVIALASILGVLFVAPNLVPSSVLDAWPDFLPKKQIVLGLDLQGGSHLLLQVRPREHHLGTDQGTQARYSLDAGQ